jgi:hypothetical protein
MKELKFYEPNQTQVLVSGKESFIKNVKVIVAENGFKKVATI